LIQLRRSAHYGANHGRHGSLTKVKFVLFMFVLQTGWQIVPVEGNPYDSLKDCRAISEALIHDKIFNWPGGVEATNYACKKLTIEKKVEKDETAR